MPVLDVGRAEVLRQAWRWRGRPTTLHPVLLDEPLNDFDRKKSEWIAQIYGEITDGDSVTCQIAVGKAPAGIPGAKALSDRGCRFFDFSKMLERSVGSESPIRTSTEPTTVSACARSAATRRECQAAVLD